MATIIKRPGPAGKTVFRAEIRRKGFPRQVKTFALKRDAVNWARKIEREMDEGIWRDLKDADKILFASALKRYLENVSIKKRPSTCKRDQLSASHLNRRLGHLSLTQITNSKVAKYRDERLREVSPHSVRIELALLSNLYNIARNEWKIGKVDNPVSGIKKPQIPEGRCPMLSQQQLEKLIEECGKSGTKFLLPFVLLALHTGCRSAELRGLSLSQINIDSGCISLVGQEVKTLRRRTIPLTETAKQVLKELTRCSELTDENDLPQRLIFPSRNNPNKPRDMHRAFDAAVKRAGLDNLPGAGKLRIHDLRHCCGSALIMNGVDLETVRKLLGHRDITTTQRYLHVIDEHMSNAISKIDHLGVATNGLNKRG